MFYAMIWKCIFYDLLGCPLFSLTILNLLGATYLISVNKKEENTNKIMSHLFLAFYGSLKSLINGEISKLLSLFP